MSKLSIKPVVKFILCELASKIIPRARIAQVLEVEVFELFKGELVPSDSKKLVANLSKDIRIKLNSALDNIFKQYLG